MGSKTVNTILNLKDKMTPKLIKTSNRIKDLDKDTQRATRRIANMSNKFATSVNKMVGKAAKFTAVGATMAGAFALKTGLGEAMNMEGFKTQLETATKSAKKAGEIMKWSVKLANATPFETGSVVEMSSKFEAMGMSAKKWGSITADMAGATNKDITQATEAIIDAQTGELERLKEFGLKKADIAKKAGEMFKNQEVINAKGQIVDQEKFNKALMQLMQEKYNGGAAALAKTTKGMWSTIIGVTKTSLANIVGMQNDGTIKQGSMLDKLKGKIQSVADALTKWQSDGTLDKIGAKFTAVFTKIYTFLTRVYTFIKKYQDWIIFIGTFVIAISGAIKIITVLSSTIKALQFIVALTNGTLALCPLMWITAGIAAVIAIGVLLWKNWDTLKVKANELWAKIKENFTKIKEFFKNPIKGIVEIEERKKKGSKQKSSKRVQARGKNALGTPYWKGGATTINERGGEIIDLPSGSKVIPADKSQKMLSQTRNKIEININAKGITAKEVINEVVPALKLALKNI